MRTWLVAIAAGVGIVAAGLATLIAVYAWANTDVSRAWIGYQTTPFLIPAVATALRLLDLWEALATTSVAAAATGGLHWWIFSDESSTAVLALIVVPVIAAIPIFVAVGLATASHADP